MDCYSGDAITCDVRECNENTPNENCYLESCISNCYPDEEPHCEAKFTAADTTAEIACDDFNDISWEMDCYAADVASMCDSRACNANDPLEVCKISYCVSDCYPEADAVCSVHFPE